MSNKKLIIGSIFAAWVAKRSIEALALHWVNDKQAKLDKFLADNGSAIDREVAK